MLVVVCFSPPPLCMSVNRFARLKTVKNVLLAPTVRPEKCEGTLTARPSARLGPLSCVPRRCVEQDVIWQSTS